MPFSFDTRDVSLLDHGRPFETTSDGCEYVVALVESGAPASVLPDAPEPELHGSVPRSARASWRTVSSRSSATWTSWTP